MASSLIASLRARGVKAMVTTAATAKRTPYSSQSMRPPLSRTYWIARQNALTPNDDYIPKRRFSRLQLTNGIASAKRGEAIIYVGAERQPPDFIGFSYGPDLRERGPSASGIATVKKFGPPVPAPKNLAVPLCQQLTFAAFVESSHQNVEVPCTPRQATHAALLHCVE